MVNLAGRWAENAALASGFLRQQRFQEFLNH